MLYYHCVVYTPFVGEEADVYIAAIHEEEAEWKAYEAAKDNGFEWLDYRDYDDDDFDEDEYFAQCSFHELVEIGAADYERAGREGEWCV